MEEDSKKPVGKVVQIGERRLQDNLDELVPGTVEEKLNIMLDAEADPLCPAHHRYERSPDRTDCRAGSYDRILHTRAGEVRNVSVLVAIGVGADGFQTILGVAEGHKEGWSRFLRHLKGRGLKGVRLVIPDACLGLKASVADFFPEADWPRCVVQFYRNLFGHVPNAKVEAVVRTLKAIQTQESAEAVGTKAADVITALRDQRLGKATQLVEGAIEETLTYYGFPDNHWIRIWTNNPLERIIQEIRRRIRVVDAFPDGQSALMLCPARLRHIAGTKWGTRRYLHMRSLFRQAPEQATA